MRTPGYSAAPVGSIAVPGQENKGPIEGLTTISPMPEVQGPTLIFNEGQNATNSSIDEVPGRVQSRINVTSVGMDHIGDRHFDSAINASQFTISKNDLKNLLQSSETASAPVTRTIQSGGKINYVREVNAGQAIGTDKFNNYQPTSTVTVITDKFGNLVTAFPGKLK
jgi:filamentous hemagglutinin